MKFFISTLLLTGCFSAQALTLRAKRDLTYGATIYSHGHAYEYDDFLTYGVNSLAARCWAWSGQTGQIRGGGSGLIPAGAQVALESLGDQVTVALEDQGDQEPVRNMEFKLLRPDGRQIGGLTCTLAARAPAPASLEDVRVFLQTQFGADAEIN